MTRWRRRIVAALLGAGCSCAALSAASPIVTRPVIHTVYASSEMSPECRVAVAHAVGQLQMLGRELALVYVPESHPAIALEPHRGEVSIRSGITRDVEELATAYVWGMPHGVERAQIVLGACAPEVALHQLAHVTDMLDRVDYERVTHAARPQWWRDPLERAY